ncbi:SGNH hydrolase-type esterase domain-containing protein [Peziza echinospora]|nr:SGNH hydrolase-type esterase domain-containing protein [Peziza echinospora]
MDFTYPKFILFGDSLTQQAFNIKQHGFAAALADDYARKVDILNRGVSGYNSRWLLPLFHRLMEQISSDVLLFIIWVGTNDACLPGSPHHVPLDELKENLHEMVTTLRTNPKTSKTRVLLITPPPIYPDACVHPDVRRSPGVTADYALATLAVAEQFSEDKCVQCLDYHKAVTDSIGLTPMQNEAGYELPLGQLVGFYTDGLHLDWKGYDVLYLKLTSLILESWPEISPKNIPLTVPWWGDLVESLQQ